MSVLDTAGPVALLLGSAACRTGPVQQTAVREPVTSERYERLGGCGSPLECDHPADGDHIAVRVTAVVPDCDGGR